MENKSSQLRQRLLEKGDLIIDYKMAQARGEPLPIPDTQAIKSEIDNMFDLLSKIILQTPDLRKIETESTKDITSALAKGKITSSEALELMQMKFKQFEIEELPALEERLEE